jgi:hypothetical protein
VGNSFVNSSGHPVYMPSDQTFFELFVHNFLSSFFETMFFRLLCKFLFWSYQLTVIIEFYGFAALQKKICSRYRLFVVLPKRRLPTILKPGIDVMIFKIIFNKKWQKIDRFVPKR